MDPILNNILGYSVSLAEIAAFIRRGPNGVDGLYNWLVTCVSNLGIDEGLLEGKVDHLTAAINLLYVHLI